MGLLSAKLQAEFQKYISVLKALELLADETQDNLDEVATYLINEDMSEHVASYIKNDTGRMIQDGDGFGGEFQKTWEVLQYFQKSIPHNFDQSRYREHYWLKNDFFGFLHHSGLSIPPVTEWASHARPDTKEPANILDRDIYLTGLDLFTHADAACLLSGDDPVMIRLCQNDTYFEQNHLGYLNACNLVNAGIAAGKLEPDYISRKSLQQFALDKGFVIGGFNDNLPDLPTAQTDNSELIQQIADLNAQLEQIRSDYKVLQSKYDENKKNGNHILTLLKHEYKNTFKQNEPTASPTGSDQPLMADANTESRQIKELKQRIAELEAQLEQLQAAGTPDTVDGQPLKGLEKVNYDIAKAKNFAKIVAKSIWAMDTDERIKTGDMVQYVKSLLIEFDNASLPEKDATLSDWLKEVKPEYAKASGRTPKDAPAEIPLTFKK